ncbi:MAG: hypothetical protein IKN63_03810 [Bacilli bacterium]|nr:hypothetical protein [Bacilli bacterium]
MEKEKKEKTNELEKKVSTLTMCMVVMGVLVLSLGGYLVYDKVGNKSNTEGTIRTVPNRSAFAGQCGMIDIDRGVVRIVNDGVPVYDDRHNQIDTLNRGDELYQCQTDSASAEKTRCKLYIRLNTDKFEQGYFNVENSGYCRNFIYLY